MGWRSNLRTRPATIILIAVLWAAVASAQVIYVDSRAGGTNDGSSWVNAYKYLQDALASASSGDEIRAAQGTYRPDQGVGIISRDREASFVLRNGVVVRGGYAGAGEANPDARDIGLYVTILNGDLDGDDEFLRNEDNSYHVLTGGETDVTAVLDGFTITGGHAFTSTGTDGSNPSDHGGGLYNLGGSPTVTGCTFIGNWAFHGGAMFNDANSSPTVSYCTFSRNSVTGITNCQGGAAYCGGGSDARFEHCKFIENAGNDGGAVFVEASAVEFEDCIFSGNTADGQGIGISCWDNSRLTVTGCTFTSNAGGAGAIYAGNCNVTVINSVFAQNSARGIMEAFVYSMLVANCTFVGNSSTYGGAMRTTSPNVTIANSIFWGNSSAQIHQQSPIEVRYSCIQDWSGGGIGNINVNPQFVRYPDGGSGNLHLKSGSPCIDAGDSDAVPGGVAADFDGSNRFGDDPCTADTGNGGAAGAVVDMGAYEYCQDSPFWKGRIVFPGEPFETRGSSADDPGWVKFTILKSEPNAVCFQDSGQYVFHYEFATERLGPFLGMTAQQFNEVSIYAENQQAILGTVITPPMDGFGMSAFDEYGIQFVRRNHYTKEEIRDLFELVKARVLCKGQVRVFYFPAYEQLPAAQANRAWLESQGVTISSTERWSRGNASYSDGWALGELKYFDGDNIQDAYLAGLLEPNDILLTDGVPAEIPSVAGVISLSPSTPNSHVAILARTFAVPFVHLAVTEDAEKARRLLGRTVFLYAKDGDVQLLDIEGALTGHEIAEVLALKAPAGLQISAMADYGAYSASTDGLLPCDTKYFGGKAANFGILRAAIPDNCPVAAAFSFRLWKEFLDQELVTHKTLREEINSRLADYTYPPSDMAALADDLSYIRDMFRDRYFTSFTHSQENAVISILQDPRYGFNANRNIRFRSSTNVEDCNYFTGAGLYDSFSGCLADDLDGNESGPCICDANETGERGVFRAIRKVFASFYNDNAFLERLRYSVNEADVGMALLAHHSFPDESELANGVATVEKNALGSTWLIKLVTQLGAVSVANPQDGSIPEEVSVAYKSASDISVQLVRSSNLVILGDTVMDWRDDYTELSRLLVLAAEQFRTVTGKTGFVLDFEYKKYGPDGDLVVKQVRELPRTAPDTAFLINKPVEYCLYQGQTEAAGDIFSFHRLKSRWKIQTKPIFLLDADNLNGRSFYGDVQLEYADAGRVRTITGKLPLWPFALHSFDVDKTLDSWRLHHLQNPRIYELRTFGVPTDAGPGGSPLLTVENFGFLSLRSEYDRPVISWAAPGGETIVDEVCLWPSPEPVRGKPYHHGLLQSRVCNYNGMNIRTTFCWPGGYGSYPEESEPLLNWVETTITGCTNEPIVLRGYYSQTYWPRYGNSTEHFLFEPRLEPGISQSVLDELRAKNIRLIHMINSSTVETYGFENEAFFPGDIDDNDDVDMRDFALFAERWLDSGCDACSGADLDGDGRVGAGDFCEFAAEWLAWE